MTLPIRFAPRSVLPETKAGRACIVQIACYFLLASAFSSSGCRKPKPGAEGASPKPTPSAAEPATAVERFGAALQDLPQRPLAEVLAAPTAHADAPIRVEGYVRRACSRKGCWMELATGSLPEAASCRVTFKDYGFFVPTDSAGAKARVEGQLKVQRLAPARVAHYEAEGAVFPNKAPDGSSLEVSLIATGVELRRQ